MENVIEVKGLSFRYHEDYVLKNASFDIKRGDYAGIIGENGSGKSTLVKLILKILPFSDGEIKILGEDINSFKKWDKVGYVSQKANSFNGSFPATVEEVVGANLYSKIGMFRFPKAEHRELVYEALNTVGMKEYGKRMIGNLSGGQQQRVFIARALVNQPDILVLDEPTVGIDAKSEEAVYCLLARLNREMGISILIVSHDISAVTVHANKIICIRNKDIIVHNAENGIDMEDISKLYGYEVNLHIHAHDEDHCCTDGRGM